MKIKNKSLQPLSGQDRNEVKKYIGQLISKLCINLGYKQKEAKEIKLMVDTIWSAIYYNKQVYYNFGYEHLEHTFDQAALGEFGDIKAIGTQQIMKWIDSVNEERKRLKIATREDSDYDQRMREYWTRQIYVTVHNLWSRRMNNDLTLDCLSGKAYIYDFLTEKGYIKPTKDQKYNAIQRGMDYFDGIKKGRIRHGSSEVNELISQIEKRGAYLKEVLGKRIIIWDFLSENKLPFHGKIDLESIVNEPEPIKRY